MNKAVYFSQHFFCRFQGPVLADELTQKLPRNPELKKEWLSEFDRLYKKCEEAYEMVAEHITKMLDLDENIENSIVEHRCLRVEIDRLLSSLENDNDLQFHEKKPMRAKVTEGIEKLYRLEMERKEMIRESREVFSLIHNLFMETIRRTWRAYVEETNIMRKIEAKEAAEEKRVKRLYNKNGWKLEKLKWKCERSKLNRDWNERQNWCNTPSRWEKDQVCGEPTEFEDNSHAISDDEGYDEEVTQYLGKFFFITFFQLLIQP